MVKNIFEDSFAPLIVEEILMHGYLEMSSVILKVLSINFYGKHSDLIESNIQLKINENYSSIKDAFKKLINGGILERLPSVESGQNLKEPNKGVITHKVPKFCILNEANKQDFPEIKIEG
jgi:hypothetical protein